MHPDEMGIDLNILLKRLNSDPIYVKQFRAAFNDTIRTQYIVKALAQFERSLIAADSRYDRYNNGDTDALTQTEKFGMSLVKKHCSACHAGELFTDQKFHNIGLDSDFSDERDEGVRQGRYRITFKEEDKGKYKTPTLRNIAITAPYMHDGRFNTLEEVLDHYHRRIKKSPSLDKIFFNKYKKNRIPLSYKEKKLSFLFLERLLIGDFGH
jgi:cytochrome c peroxidase